MSLPAGVLDKLELSSNLSMEPAGSDIGDNTRCCKYSQVLLMMGKKHRPKHVKLTTNNKLAYIFASCWLFSEL